ncbi:MAG TPA: DUF4124 domain-containing protein [Usitatibacter sp.]|nr:DUF4124 domain-containing protein [Usitatibacter sp.]
MRAAAWLALVAAAGLWQAAAAAPLYKWVDEKGVTHYSETPPPDGKATRLELPSSPSPAPGTDSPERWKEKDLEFRRQQIEKEHADERGKANVAKRRELCLRARSQLDILTPGRPVYRVNEQGERVYMDDNARAAETSKWAEVAKASCDD